ncbi:MAG: hypothetical protein A2039_01400 [Candidatus Melainabacteria bacterium GWA2_34_9]|nr:MAG: hypothetical protein A2039_01400 [Candidatus Melainabacteria bacterium GWA2_34_9]
MSLFTTISGITNNQAMLDVIGDNIANINTVGFKSSKISFETIFSNTLSSGSVPTATTGGTNPKQVGLGVTISEISKNFGRGSIQTTGRNTDLNIQGEGFFTLMDPTGRTLLSRAGNFSADSEGNIVNPKGLKVVGTSDITSSTGGTTTVKMPTSLVLTETNTIAGGATNITPGNFTIDVAGIGPQTIAVENTDTIQDVIGKINSTMGSAPFNSTNVASLNTSNQLVITGPDTVALADDTSNFATAVGLNASYTSVAFVAPAPDPGDFTIDVNGAGPVAVTVGGADTYDDVAAAIQAQLSPGGTATYDATANKIVISGPDTLVFANGTSTFAVDAGFVQGGGPYTTLAMTDTPKVDISAAATTGPELPNTFKATAFSISNNGALEITYSNGARLTVTTLPGDTTRSLKYTSSGSEEITGTDLTQTAGAVVDPAQLQIQLAQVINPKGLESIGGNMFSINAAAGTPTFAIGSAGGLGSIDAGSLEASNVDLPNEFAAMILAQKAVEANSRAFSVQNQIMDTIVNLGR